MKKLSILGASLFLFTCVAQAQQEERIDLRISATGTTFAQLVEKIIIPIGPNGAGDGTTEAFAGPTVKKIIVTCGVTPTQYSIESFTENGETIKSPLYSDIKELIDKEF